MASGHTVGQAKRFQLKTLKHSNGVFVEGMKEKIGGKLPHRLKLHTTKT